MTRVATRVLLVALGAAAAGACQPPGGDDAISSSPTREVREVRSFPAPTDGGVIAGIAVTGDGDVWLAYWYDSNDYYQKHRVALVRYHELLGAEVQRIELQDYYERASGLAWDGTSLWLHYGGTGDNIVVEIDPVTGAERRTMAVPVETCDLSWDGARLVVESADNTIWMMDRARGAFVEKLALPPIEPGVGQDRAVGVVDGTIWTTRFEGGLLQLDLHGHLLASSSTDVRAQFQGQSVHLAALGHQLVAAGDQEVVVYDVGPLGP